MSSLQGESLVRSLEAMLEQSPVEDVVEALVTQREALPRDERLALADLEMKLYERVLDETAWADRARAARALRFCLDVAYERDLVDGDTPTYLLIRAVELDPTSDELVLEYLRSVADSDYRYTDRSLAEIAERVDDPLRAQRLALLDAIAEYFVLRGYLPTYEDVLRRAFAAAVARGAGEAEWQDARAWVVSSIPYAEVPEDLFGRYASAA